MRNRTLILFMLIGLVFVSCSQAQNKQAKTRLNASEFAQMIKDKPGALLLDVRTPGEFADGHLEQAVNIDWNAGDFEQKMEGTQKSKPVLVYCLSGGRSAAAAASLRKMGFAEVYELDGGMMKWRKAGLPETTESAAPKKTGMTMEQYNALLVSDRLVLVDFYAEWCAPCKKMKPYLEEIAQELKQKVQVVRIDADEHPELCTLLGIDGLPVLHLYDKGNLKWSYKGYLEKEEVVAALNR